MAIVSPRTILNRVVAQIATLDGWSQSRYPFDLFPADTQALQHLAFAVGMPSTTVRSSVETKRGADGALCDTSVRVRWAYRIRQDAQASDYALALDAEQTLITCVLGTDEEETSPLILESASRRVEPEGLYLLGDAAFSVTHRIMIQGA